MKIVNLVQSPSAIVVSEMLLLAVLQLATFSVLVRVTNLQTVGLWVLVNAVLAFSRAADFWSVGLSSFVGDARGRGETSKAADFVVTALLTGLVGYAVLAITAGAILYAFAEVLAGPEHVAIVHRITPITTITFWLLSLAGVYNSGFLAFGRPALKAVQTVGGAALFLLLAVLFAPSRGLIGILAAQAVQALAMLMFSTVAFLRLFRGEAPIRWRREYFRMLASFGTKALGVSSLQLAVEPIIRLLVNEFGGLSAVATVDLASRLIMVARNAITAIGQILVPEFARLGANALARRSTLFREASRLFFLAAVPSFALLISASPAIKDLALGQRGPGFVAYLGILSAGWLANTVTAPSYFLLLSKRRLQPLFWAHLTMAGGTILLGTAGGMLAGVYGALGGATAALFLASVVLIGQPETAQSERKEICGLLLSEPGRLAPLACSGAAVVLISNLDIANANVIVRAAVYGTSIAATLTTIFLFGDVRGVIRHAAQIR